jgi:hypothetical protein
VVVVVAATVVVDIVDVILVVVVSAAAVLPSCMLKLYATHDDNLDRHVLACFLYSYKRLFVRISKSKYWGRD